MSDIESFDVVNNAAGQNSYIKVVGVGGAGTNAVNHMYNKGIIGVDFIVCNTDEQSLSASPVGTKIKIGEGGLGAGNRPEIAQKAAIAAADEIKNVLSGNTHMLFIAAGMGGGTGTGASPEIAKMAKEIEVDGGKDEILVVAVVTIPFSFEGRKRKEQARIGVENLKKTVDSIIIVNTDKLKSRGNMPMRAAFALADDVLLTAVKGLSEMMTADAYVHVDFRDVQSIMQHSGVALMGSGVGEGEDRAFEAIKAATTSDLLNDNDLKGTKNVLLYISFSSKDEYQFTTDELTTVTDYISEITNADVDMIWGFGTDDSLDGKVAITLVATGFESKEIYVPSERDNTRVVSLESKKTENILPPTPVEPIKEHLNIDNTPVIERCKDTKTEYATSTEDFTVIDKNVEQEKEQQMNGEDHIVKIALGDDNPMGSLFAPSTPIESIDKGYDVLPKNNNIEKSSTDNQIEFSTKSSTQNAVMEEPIAEDTHEEAEPMFSLKDITSEGTVQTPQPVMPMSMQKALEMKKDRIKRIHDMLKAGKADDVMKIHPTEDLDMESVSSVSAPATHLSLTQDGSFVVQENPTLNSKVD